MATGRLRSSRIPGITKWPAHDRAGGIAMHFRLGLSVSWCEDRRFPYIALPMPLYHWKRKSLRLLNPHFGWDTHDSEASRTSLSALLHTANELPRLRRCGDRESRIIISTMRYVERFCDSRQGQNHADSGPMRRSMTPGSLALSQFDSQVTSALEWHYR